MSRERAARLAALACDASTTEHEANAAARILAKLVHEHPELLTAAPSAPAVEGSALDPFMGAVVREAATAAADLMRDYLGRRAAREAAQRAVKRGVCPMCGEPADTSRPSSVFSTGTRVVRCIAGHSYIISAPTKAAPKAGPKKVAPKKRRRVE